MPPVKSKASDHFSSSLARGLAVIKAFDRQAPMLRIADVAERTGLDRVFLAAPTSTDERLAMIAEASTGFVYTVSTMGITGERAELDAAARTLVARGADIIDVGAESTRPGAVRRPDRRILRNTAATLWPRTTINCIDS